MLPVMHTHTYILKDTAVGISHGYFFLGHSAGYIPEPYGQAVDHGILPGALAEDLMPSYPVD